MKTYFKANTHSFWYVHLLALSIIIMTFSLENLYLAVGAYYFRMFFVSAGYHRYFGHRTFSTSRVFQFVLAFLAMTSVQKGVLWWASHHREHHKSSDRLGDIHSPKQGHLWSHIGWFLSDDHGKTNVDRIGDFTRFPELVWLDRNWAFPPLVYIIALWWMAGLEAVHWGFFVSTVMLWHGTFTINSLAHLWGGKRYETSDGSRNNALLALLTLGEGWHNNHHRYPGAARNGFFWWELDVTWLVLKLLSFTGLVWGLRPVPTAAYADESGLLVPENA